MSHRLEEPWKCPEGDCHYKTDWVPSINRHTGPVHGWVYQAGPGSEKVPYGGSQRMEEAEEKEQGVGKVSTDGEEQGTMNGHVAADDLRDIVEGVVEEALGELPRFVTLSEARSIAWNTSKERIQQHRRRVLEDLGMTLLEGRVRMRKDGQGSVRARIDHTDVAELLNHYLDDGEHVRLIVQVMDREELAVNGAEKSASKCALCGDAKESRGPFCRSCWRSKNVEA